MEFLRKIWKGVKKVFKKVGKGIKKVVKKVGKFADKLGIVGQIGLMIALPAIGGWLMSSAPAWIASLGHGGAIAQGFGKVLQGTLNFTKTVGNVFSTISKGVTSFISTTGKYIGGKLGLQVGGQKMANISLSQAWDIYSGEVMNTASTVFDPWKATVPSTTVPSTTVPSTYNPGLLREDQMSYMASAGGAGAPPVAMPGTDYPGTDYLEAAEQYMISPEYDAVASGLQTAAAMKPPSLLSRAADKAGELLGWGEGGLPARVGQAVGDAIAQAPVTYAMQKMQQGDLEDFYAEQRRLAEEQQTEFTAGGIPSYEDTPRAGLSSLPPQETVGWEYYTGAPNQRLGGTGTDPTGTYGYSAWQSTLDRALGRA